MTTTASAGTRSYAKRAALASGVGTLVEWYDFFIFGTAAALVFPVLFFPEFDPLTGTLLSFATFAGGFAARPIGAILFGHLGDRIGRRAVLMVTLVLMGTATLLMGFLPTHETIGTWAPILLVALRILQGLAVSGEFGGAVLLAIEHAPENRRGLYGSAPQISVPIALVLSSTVFLLASAAVTEEQFLAWGWRIPFIASIIAVAIGLWIRISVPETTEFAEVKKRQEVEKAPLLAALRQHGRDFWLVVLAYPATGMTYYVLTTFCVTYGVSVGFGRDQMLWITVISAAIMLVLIPAGAAYSDKIGRKPIYAAGLIVMAAGVFPLFVLVGTGNIVLAFVGFIIPTAGFSLSWGVLTTFFGDVFGVRMRYSGLGTAYTLGTILGSSTAPFVAAFILSQTGSVYWVGGYMLVWIAISFVATMFMRETRTKTRSLVAETIN